MRRSDLDAKEQNYVRTALRILRRRLGGWIAVAKATRFQPDTVRIVAGGYGKSVTASMALRVARLFDVPVDDLLSGRYLVGACPKCGHVPDFAIEQTIVEDGPRPAPGGGGLKLVK